MTPDYRIAQLESLVATLQRTVEAQARALEDSAARLREEGDAAKMLRERREAARLKKQRQRAERLAVIAASRDTVPALSPGQSRDNDGTPPLSPPLDGSPLSSKPSLPSPLSSPQSPFSATQRPADAVPERPELVLTAQKARKPQRKHREPTPAETLYKDLQESRQERCAEVGEPFISDNWDFARQNERLRPLCGLPPEEGERLTRAWGLYLEDAENRAREPPWSLAYFLSPGVRSKYETRAAREAAA